MLRALVVGGGAVGSWLGGSLAAGGAEVTLAEPGPRRATLETAGIALVSARGLTRVKPAVAASIARAGPVAGFDIVVVAVRGYHTEAVARELSAGGAEPAAVASFQNGVGNDALLAAALPATQVITATLTTGLQIEAGGAVRGSRRGGVGLASVLGADALAAHLRAGGLTVRRYDDAASMKWSKLLLNLIGSATCAVLGWPPDRVFADRRLFDLERRAWLEALAVVRALGLRPVDLPGYPVRLVSAAMARLPDPLAFRLLGGRIAGARGDRLPGVSADLAAGRSRTENDVLTGAVVRHGRDLSVPVPVSAALCELVEGIADGSLPRERFLGRPEALLAALGRNPA